jgi:hypothetical protein
MKKIINEGLDYHDLVGQMDPVITVDEYAAHMGKDSEIVTVSFVTHSEAAGNDLADWFERGYDYVLDAEVSEGEVSPGKYLVFVEMNRRSTVPERIIELINDLETLTDLPLKDWTIKIVDEEYEPDEAVLKQKITISPHEYRKDVENEEELNEMREIAGIPTKPVHQQDEYIRTIKSMAGL